MAINKKEFVNTLAEKGVITKKNALDNVDLFLETFVDCLREDGTVKLYGFGRFELKTVKEKIGRNPRNQKEYIIPEHKKVKFYASETLTDKIEK